MSNVEDKVLNRIKKMLNLANDPGASEGERENAMRMAYNLLAKYNIDIKDLPGDHIEEAREELTTVISADKWARTVAHAVAKLFFCKYLFSRTSSAGRDQHHFIGRASNVATASYMASYLIAAIKREASKRYSSPTSPNGRSFCVGTASMIWYRATEMMVKPTEDVKGDSANALVVLHKTEEEANQTWMDEQKMKVKNAVSRVDNSLRAGAYRDGQAHGKTVSLNAQIGGARNGVKLLGN